VQALAFLDDDERPTPEWLSSLLRAQERFGCEIVGGPVLPEFADRAPAWAVEGPFFQRPRFPTGTQLRHVNTGNVLLAARLAEIDLRFDPRFGLSGGEDTLFFLSARDRGLVARWCNEAVVYERLDSSRLTIKSVCARAYANGASFSRIETVRHPGLSIRLRRMATGLSKVILSLLSAPAEFLRGWIGFITICRGISRGLGSFVGACGVEVRLYRKSE
jgi:hypothetical protein